MNPAPPPTDAAADDAPRELTPRGEDTRRKIVDAALELFRESGYDATTMRAVAARAGVSVGNAYYYFPSKDTLLQGYYERSHEAHLARVRPKLEGMTSLEDRLRVLLEDKIEGEEPYHRFAGLLFKTAADPQSPLNPFSPESSPTRCEAIALMHDVLQGSKVRVPKDLASRLPELLWLFEMSVILFGIHDHSAGRQRTRALIEQGSALVARLVTLAGNRLLAPLRKRVVTLLEAVATTGTLTPSR